MQSMLIINYIIPLNVYFNQMKVVEDKALERELKQLVCNIVPSNRDLLFSAFLFI